MSATRILWGQVLIIFLIVLAATWGLVAARPMPSLFA